MSFVRFKSSPYGVVDKKVLLFILSSCAIAELTEPKKKFLFLVFSIDSKNSFIFLTTFFGGLYAKTFSNSILASG